MYSSRADWGCQGGFPERAYQYVMAAGGIQSEQSYPYTSEDGKVSACTVNSSHFEVGGEGGVSVLSQPYNSCSCA